VCVCIQRNPRVLCGRTVEKVTFCFFSRQGNPARSRSADYTASSRQIVLFIYLAYTSSFSMWICHATGQWFSCCWLSIGAVVSALVHQTAAHMFCSVVVFCSLTPPSFLPPRERERDKPHGILKICTTITRACMCVGIYLWSWNYGSMTSISCCPGGGNVCVSLDCKSLSLARSLSLLFTQ
jgi:hypothetical protein